MACAWVLRGVIEKLKRYFRFFLWCHDGGRRGLHVAAWEKIGEDKVDGGLGIRELRPSHNALMEKQRVKTMIRPESICTKIVNKKYGVGT